MSGVVIDKEKDNSVFYVSCGERHPMLRLTQAEAVELFNELDKALFEDASYEEYLERTGSTHLEALARLVEGVA